MTTKWDGDSDPVQAFDARIRAKVLQGMSRQQAVMTVAEADSDLHQAFLEATNDPEKAPVIRDKFRKN